MRGGKELFAGFVFAVFPKRCAFCGKVIVPSVDSCDGCEKSVSRVQHPVCPLCGRGKEECMCKNHQCFYVSLAAPFYYEDAVGKCIRSFKFNGKTQHARLLGKEMAKTARQVFKGKDFDIVTGVPLAAKSLKARGYNQSSLLSKEVGKNLGIKNNESVLRKIVDTPAQHSVSASLRRGNLAGAFETVSSEMIEGKSILLCDDIATTGSTLNECAKMLMLAGAKEVYCLTAAVTRKTKSN